MKVFLWGTALLLAVLWTAGVAVAVEVLQWSVSALAAGGVTEVTGAIARIPLPEWLAPFVDLLGGQQALAAIVTWLQSISTLLPSVSQSLDWLVPALWVVWGLGLLALLILTTVISRFVKR